MSEQSFLEQRLDASTWPIAVGDIVVLLAFIFLGTLSHWPLDAMLADPTIYLAAAGPFLLGWVICAPLIGAYSPGGGSAPNSSIPLAIRSWVPAAIVGFVVRYVALPQRGVEPVFIGIMLVGGAVVISAWRFLYFKLR
ncbi:DUF3054 family protein [Natronomonas pharaonis DSM 2160]|uniref:DUF3054 family protein n=1 Tax=Natronomonas pharaonis (strain ATCC 35678 / DSM 2160 / CIP 103997 / JCM 8858 / NBRC 14720 / NCIMB 2260 / Gabara) TaxID=348780 RepID=A0A1U7EXR7_NATPD|nr:DUF3054 domain-containing protein [Natronomonas pharaonis]CAI49988.1 DUF3054 family protein [Natronomonas pharaonis DSM 2160]